MTGIIWSLGETLDNLRKNGEWPFTSHDYHVSLCFLALMCLHVMWLSCDLLILYSATDLLPQRKPQYDTEKQICSALIAYVEKLSIVPAPAPSATPIHPISDQSSQGEVLLVKREDNGFLVPASHRKKSKRDKRRNAVGTKVHYYSVYCCMYMYYNVLCLLELCLWLFPTL